ncbi:tRNA (uracil-5-)-methyltransferase homolog B-like isoform X2 [Oratosquilla oratoria]|uniref:tRNA (uracil-5-)-methyltransferase homolog B-like isoform X2 n=1 Tax=Oratosquilla oratoria TaxID=337810 RepID=UPI003F76E446
MKPNALSHQWKRTNPSSVYAVSIPCSEDQLQDLQKQEHNRLPENDTHLGAVETCLHKVERQTKSTLTKQRERKALPVEPQITFENQYEKLSETVTPLYMVPYNEQLRMKEQKMKGILKILKKRLIDVKAPLFGTKKGLPCYLDQIRASPDILAYRNKDEFGVKTGVDGNPKTVGFYIGKGSEHNLTCVPATHLINMRESHKEIASSFQNFIRSSQHPTCLRFDDGGIWRNITVRSGSTGEKMATVTIHPQELHNEEILAIAADLKHHFSEGPGAHCQLDSLYLQACKHTRCTREQAPYLHLMGKEYITEECCNLHFRISPDSFFQINPSAASVLFDTVKEIAEVSPLTTLLDVCCGTGAISLIMAPYVRGSVGIEVISAAIEDAKQNALFNNITNVSFICNKAEKVLPSLVYHLSDSVDVVAVVNPARGGLHPDVIRAIRKCTSINKLLYISCKPDGFAMENFVKLGSTRGKASKDDTAPFVPRYAVPVDMFPHTEHVELVMLFERVME